MNKKRLSVVMAGAMLATSVAPVLAAETTDVAKSEHSAAELGLLIGKIRTKLTSATFAADTVEDVRRNGAKAGKSIYFIAVDGVKVALDESSSQADYQRELGKLKVGQEVSIWQYANVEENGKYYVNKKEDKKFTEDSLAAAAAKILGGTASSVGNSVQTNYTNIISSAKYDADTDMLKIDFAEKVNENKVSDLVLTVGSTEYVVDNYLDKDGKVVAISSAVAVGDFFGFPTKSEFSPEGLKNKELEKITITPGGYSLTVADLYDGLFLTKKGNEFFAKMNAALAAADTDSELVYKIDDANSGTPIGHFTRSTVAGLDSDPTKYDSNPLNIVKKNGKYVVTVEFIAQAPAKKNELYTITGTNKDDMIRLLQWMMTPKARVDVLAGDNRYETAVEIAKEYAGLNVKVPTGTTATNTIEDIVLVNGNALVDGLAAAPLAATLENGTHKVPMLLTEANQLPKATKEYLKELRADQIVGANKTTIHLVGGDAVLSKSLERELRSFGFKIERYDGDNREETSLAVAEAINKKNTTNKKAFVVGAEGEADAMSIASVATEIKAPIIVAKKGGITEDALYDLKGKNVAVIGGEGVLSASDYKAIKAEAKSIERVYGSNRKETNAEIIAKYYTESFVGAAKNVMVAKDGQNNKSELVDALAAANLAAQKDAPIVLATDKLSSSQVNALELNAKGAFGLYQIGNGVTRGVVKTIAENLGLSNR